MRIYLSLLVAVSTALLAADKPTPPAAAAPTQNVPAKKPVYRPPLRGAPAVRVDGGSRGQTDALPTLFVIAPDHTGLASGAQPSLYWFQSKPATARMEFTVIADDAAAPLLEIAVPPTSTNRYRSVNLAEHKVSLQENSEYQWSIALVPDPDNRSKDILASGRVRRAPLPPELREALTRATPAEKPALYAEAGFWYDAIASLQELLEKDTANAALLDQRNALLSQVGLTKLIPSDNP